MQGLFGLTGASFIAYNNIDIYPVNSIYFDINTHISSGVTGPYHQILSLLEFTKLSNISKEVKMA